MYPLCSRARWYGIAARSKDSLSDEMSERRLLIDSGMLLIITGGWLDLVWIYKGVLFGFVYGICLPVVRLSVTSRKSTHFLLASMVIFRP